ncbi:MAG TPA: hypothetical protein VFK80_07840, partial [Limnochordia bacterium]|nr:hypothetical protein [Limnochordia bacterium]
LSLQPAASKAAGAPAAPAEVASDDPFVGTWQADLSTVPAQQPPLKGITLAVSAATDGYQFHEVDTLDQPGTGVAQMTADTPIRLTGKAYAVDLGYTLTCERGAARTIHCLAQMSGQTLYDERLVVGADAGTLTQTMKGPDESGQEVQVVTVYHKG